MEEVEKEEADQMKHFLKQMNLGSAVKTSADGIGMESVEADGHTKQSLISNDG